MFSLLQAALSERYAIERELGRGGMASVWLARDLRHDRPVAIKVLHPELAGVIGVDRFIREIRVTARLQHPNIVPVLDSGTFTGPAGVELPWYAMAYVPGESLRARLDRERQLPIGDALRIAEETASALEAAHRDGIVHRDIKPENLLLSGGRTCVADFGIAKALVETGGERLTSSGLIIGTPAYMSPEQATGDDVDARTDQYSLATVMYEMLAGEPPFAGRTAQAIMARRMTEAPRPIHPVRPSVPESVEAALQRGMQRIAADRFPSIAEFASALRGTATTTPGATRRTGHRRLSPAVVAAGLLLVAATVVAGWLGARRPSAPPRDPEVATLVERGVQAYRRRTHVGARESVQLLTAAIARDSGDVRAWAALSRTYVQVYGRRFDLAGVGQDSVLRLAIAAADRAIQLDRNSGDAWISRANVSRMVDPTNLTPALAAVRRGLSLDSTIAFGWHQLAVSLAETDGMAAAIPAWRRSVALDPRYEEGAAFLAMAHYWQRRYDSATVWADSSLVLDPTYLLGRSTDGFIAASQGDFARARAAFEAAQRITTDIEVVNSVAGVALAAASAGDRAEARELLARADSMSAAYRPLPQHTVVYFAQARAALGDTARAIELLRNYSPRAHLHFQLHLRCDPGFDPLANDPRFTSLLTRPRADPRTGC